MKNASLAKKLQIPMQNLVDPSRMFNPLTWSWFACVFMVHLQLLMSWIGHKSELLQVDFHTDQWGYWQKRVTFYTW